MESQEEKREVLSQKEVPNPNEKAEIISQLQDLSKKIESIENSYKAASLFGWIEPHGQEGRGFDKEIEYAISNREEGYIPQFTYPALERGYLEEGNEDTKLDIEGGLSELSQVAEKAPDEYSRILPVALPFINKKRKEFLFLQAVKDGRHEDAIRYMPYGHPDSDLVDYANEVLEKRKEEKKDKGGLAKRVSDNKFIAKDLAEYFEHAAEIMGAEGWDFEITEDVSRISVSAETKKVKIPRNREVDGIKFLKLIGHELGAHVGTAQKAIENGFGAVPLGEDAAVLQEGLAKLAEKDIEAIFGVESHPFPFYVLGINKAVETNGDFWQTFDYLNEITTQKTAKNVVKRIFRGAVDLSKGGYVFTKDKAYLEGELVAEKVKKDGLLPYIISGKFDLETALFLFENGVLPEESVELTLEVARRIWENEGDRDFIENLDWYRENYNPPYWRELGISDEEYLQAWQEGKPIKPKG